MLLLLPQNGLLLTNRLRLVLDLLLHPSLLLQLESLDDFLDRPEHLLLPFDRLHLPLGLLSCAVLVLLMYMAVLVDVELVGFDAAGASSEFAAGFLLYVVPESASLVVAAAATPGSATRATALAVWLLGVRGILEAVGEGMGGVGFGPGRPSVLVVAADAAHEAVAELEHERSLLEGSSIHD